MGENELSEGDLRKWVNHKVHLKRAQKVWNLVHSKAYPKHLHSLGFQDKLLSTAISIGDPSSLGE